jgi:hypothetical protein
MRVTVSAALFALSLLPAAALAQTNNPQTANADPAAAAAPQPSRPGGITKEQFIQRAQDRAARRAAVLFDRIDADHNGVLDPAEMRAWQSQHARGATSRSDQLPPQ